MSNVPDDWNPFERTLAFTARAVGTPVARAWDRGPIQPIEPLDHGADTKLDIDGLERLAAFHGVAKRPRLMRDDEYPDALVEQMTEREPPFVLRNLPRVERETFEESGGELERHRTLVGVRAEGVERDPLPDLTPALLDDMTLAVFAAERRKSRWLRDEAQWNRYFCKELKDVVVGPMWRYDPDAVEDAQDETRLEPGDEAAQR